MTKSGSAGFVLPEDDVSGHTPLDALARSADRGNANSYTETADLCRLGARTIRRLIDIAESERRDHEATIKHYNERLRADD